jgi:two-component system cell cycle response regulator DivK
MAAHANRKTGVMMHKILLIEDIQDNALLVQKILSSQGYEVLWAETAEQGLDLATECHPEMILLDLGLPDIDGQTLVGYLRNVPELENVPIIVVSAWPEETARSMVTAYGCDGYVSKPINVRYFIEVVNDYFSRKD